MTTDIPGSEASPSPVGLPAGLTCRPLTRDDAKAVFEVIAAQEIADLGEADIDESDLHSDWARPSHDLSARSIAVLDGDTIVAYGEIMGVDRADAAVHPNHRGRGIGTWVAHWIADLGRRLGSPVVGMPVPEGSPGDVLLESLGWKVRWTSWVLELPGDALIPARDLPEGYTIGTAAPEDYTAAHDVLEDAFLEWSVRDRETYEDFEASLMGRPGFEPWRLRVVKDAEGAVVGVAVVIIDDTGVTAYVDRLATRADQRRRGIAQALLVDSFEQGRAHGASKSELSTDSRTGALGLYEGVGMVVTDTWVNRAMQLD